MFRTTARHAALAALSGLLALVSPATAQKTPKDELLLVDACNAFGHRLYETLAEEGNPTCSPGSISVALLMLLPGARGETANEIAKVLQLPEDLRGERLQKAASRLLAVSAGRRDDGAPSMRIRNDFWVQKDYPLLPAYTEMLRKRFTAGAHELDFGDVEAARATINRHIAEATNDRIRELLEPGTITPLSRVVLTNALWFKDAWTTQFSQHATVAQPFTRQDGSQVDVQMMHHTEHFEFASNDEWSAVVMPFENSTMQFEAIVPGEGVDLAVAERAMLSGAHRGELSNERVLVRMPRFRATASHNLVDALKKMGMKLAFESGADFRGIEPDGDLVVSRVEHKVWVDVDENGAEAAAATAVVLKLRGARPGGEPKHFDADKAFVFGLRDRKTGLLWFVGRVTDPSVKD